MADLVMLYFPRSASIAALVFDLAAGTPSTSVSVSVNSGGTRPLNKGIKWQVAHFAFPANRLNPFFSDADKLCFITKHIFVKF